MPDRLRSSFVAAIAAALLLCLPAAALRAQSLGQTLVHAYENSGLLEQNRALLRAADEDVAQLVSSLRPIINYAVDVTRTFGKTQTNGIHSGLSRNTLDLGLSLDLLLYDFGRTRLQISAARETVLATREALRSIEQQVLLRAVAAHMGVIRDSQLLSVRQNNLRLLQQELRAAEDRFEVGEVTRTDVALAEARLASARSGLAAARGALLQSIEEYRAAVGHEPGTLQPPRSLPRLSGDVDGAKNIAMRKHPDMLRARYDVAAADFTVEAAAAAMKPRIGFSAGVSVGEQIDNSDYARTGSFGVTMSGPIYQGGLLSSAKRQAMARADSLRGALHVVRHRVVQDVGNAYAILRAANASRQASEEGVRAARVAFRGVREEASLGARTTLDVLDAEQELLDAQATQISADTDVYVAAYAVLASIGELTAKDLRLNVQIYDPAAYYDLVKDAPVPISPQGKKLERVLRALGKE